MVAAVVGLAAGLVPALAVVVELPEWLDEPQAANTRAAATNGSPAATIRCDRRRDGGAGGWVFTARAGRRKPAECCLTVCLACSKERVVQLQINQA